MFLVKSFQDKASRMYQQTLPTKVINFIWQNRAPPRAKIVFWLLVHDRLKTGALLHHKGIVNEDQSRCTFCGEKLETISHLFFTCDFSWRVWMQMFTWWKVNSALHSDVIPNILSWSRIVYGKFKKKLWNSSFINVFWSIWFLRNQAIFEEKNLDLNEFVYSIKVRLGQSILCYEPEFPYRCFRVVENLKATWSWKKMKKTKLG